MLPPSIIQSITFSYILTVDMGQDSSFTWNFQFGHLRVSQLLFKEGSNHSQKTLKHQGAYSKENSSVPTVYLRLSQKVASPEMDGMGHTLMCGTGQGKEQDIAFSVSGKLVSF